MDNQKRHGFTIVELLIVIVVIGILAAISTVAYSGIQQKARNAIRMNYAKQYAQIISLSLVDNSPIAMTTAMDHSDGWDKACLGAGYKDINSDGRGDCAAWLGTPYASDTTTFSALLAKTALPSMVSYPVIKSTNGMDLYGQYVTSANIDGEVMVTLEYALEGLEQDCVFKPLVYRNGSAVSLTPWGDPKYTVSANGVTECRLAVSKGY